ncbi:hypothetical protein [Actinoplanes couchii]|uniref:DUF1963 domain-containing protein n=1 Tax=Actinoplanes couchii TaxID=403638 RepID=A0ABQ3X8H3_9ACTN|nr:hypothetical protein [Actinoplanes couchii]MDR6320265.1 hypothetical protein [Actinoplanes couchii]GID54720.1 hypothetical protein Aco03nite_031240 [Actinoplanes couchii]
MSPARIEITTAPAGPGDRNTVGGTPFRPAGEPWPSCYCGARMVFFFQVDIPDGGHLTVFQCPVHDDAAYGPARLPDRYWDEVTSPFDGVFWQISISGSDAPAAAAEPLLRPLRLELRPETGPADAHGFKLGGTPSWAQEPEPHWCACGTEMTLLCQIPENFGFDMWPMRDDRAEQAQLFLGNEIYLLACPARCHPRALWPVAQN